MKKTKMTGLNVQWPWSKLLVSGEKTVETRSYPLPDKFKDVDLALVETPGPIGRLKKNNIRTKIIGSIRFSGSFQYESYEDWLMDFDRHRVPKEDSVFGYRSGMPKWGWIVSSVKELESPSEPPEQIGRVFTNDCLIGER